MEDFWFVQRQFTAVPAKSSLKFVTYWARTSEWYSLRANLYLGRFACGKVVPAHRSMVSSMQVINRQKMVTGSRDGTVKVWDQSLECIRTFDMKQIAVGCMKTQVRSACFDNALQRIVVGMASSDIYEISFLSGSCTKLRKPL